ncbi:Pol protein [Phytophthora palmivora]|uniref:Pol protein n=1 Tax=Phytophthora palmivora TaxID=4796 RepID=A0A2P4X2Y4_9STRA|nr:Pol protein [Phytophthora palmivora]
MVEFALSNAATTPPDAANLAGGAPMLPSLTIISRVRDAIALAQGKQKGFSDNHSRRKFNVFNVRELVLLDTKNLPLNLVNSVESDKIMHRFIGPFAALARHDTVYTIDLPKRQWRRSRRSTWSVLSGITIH